MPSIDLSLLIARLGFGLTMLLAHGLPKLNNYSTLLERFGDPIGIGVTATLILAIICELGGSLLVILGLFTRVGCLGLISTMSVAFFIVHATDPFSRKEMSFLYLIGFLFIFIAGPGKYSLQGIFKINSSSRLPFVAWLLK